MIQSGLFDVSRRIFSNDPAEGPAVLSLYAARGERLSCQLALRRSPPTMKWATDRSTGTRHWTVLAKGETTENRTVRLRFDGTPSLRGRIRAVGNVPLLHHTVDTPLSELDGTAPGFIPDVLFEDDTLTADINETRLFWITIEIPHNHIPGKTQMSLVLEDSEGTILRRFTIQLNISRIRLKHDSDFMVTHWLDLGSLYAYYQTNPEEERFWGILERYLAALVRNGNNMAWIPFLSSPCIDGTRIPQLLDVERDRQNYRFNWDKVERYVNLCRKSGFRFFEFEHIASPWGALYGICLCKKNRRLLWSKSPLATGKTYTAFLQQMLPELSRKLREWHIADTSFLHISDEPQPKDLPAYLALRKLIRQNAPELQTMDALSDYEFMEANAVDLPVPIVGCVKKFRKHGKRCMTYFCCGPKLGYVNRFLDTPLRTIRICGWLFQRFETAGFLHWAANYWRTKNGERMINPFLVSDGGNYPEWPSGDCFILYPGKDGPLDSIRGELFFLGLQDKLLLETLHVSSKDPLLKNLRDFNQFPDDPTWINHTHNALLLDNEKKYEKVFSSP